MPTPKDECVDSEVPAPDLTDLQRWSLRPTCPPEERRVNAPEHHRGADGSCDPDGPPETHPLQQPTPPAEIDSPSANPEPTESQVASVQSMESGEHGVSSDLMIMSRPTSAVAESRETESRETEMREAESRETESRESDSREGDSPSWPSGVTLPDVTQSTANLSMKNDFSNVRLPPSFCSSFLRPGSKFHGTQRSDRQVYDVQVELKHVDISQSFLCGYLRIQGLTKDYPTLTTYFEGEIIGDKYSFHTKHPEWGSNDKVDMQHWARFNAWLPLAKSAKRQNFAYKNFAQKEFMFMRWKEYFLIPDHRVQTISGASFEGFYYICFNQVKGSVSGIYFHARSEKYQQLELTHVDDRGCFGAMEFR
ncbi:MAG: sphinganine kinase lcb4 [Chaenotheca gracillima]|nr:MAG: sphinganine kinase lcb4 [Chaenotheca gracillima]